MIRRRAVLSGTLSGFAALSLSEFSTRSFAAGGIGVVPFADRFSLLTGAGGNVLVFSTDQGRVLVDSAAAEFSEALVATLSELPGEPTVQTLFNTHWHTDQTGSNAVIGQSGAAIIAHEKTRVHLATAYYLPGEDRYRLPLPDAAQPTLSFYSSGEMSAADEPIEYGYLLEAHTDGDIYVFFRNANILAVGDVISPVRDPVLDWFGGGWLGGRVDSLAQLLAISNADTVFVPSYGPVVGRAEVQAEHDMMAKLFEDLRELVRQGLGAEDIFEAGVMDDLGRSFDDPLQFLYDAHKGMWAHHNTLSPDVV